MACELDHSQQSGKFCKSCGTSLAPAQRTCTQGHSLASNARFCAQCGSPAANSPVQSRVTPPQPVYPTNITPPPVTINNTYAAQAMVPPFPVMQKTNGMAVASLVISIACCWPVGLVLGIVAINQINNDPSQKGKGLAVAGIVLGSLGAVGTLIYFAAAGSGY